MANDLPFNIMTRAFAARPDDRFATRSPIAFFAFAFVFFFASCFVVRFPLRGPLATRATLRVA
jgi:hypothetical protein